tara:strand:- start:301 stop:492 length:192 start_codon:yes stop_codon:yes gene_type:complete
VEPPDFCSKSLDRTPFFYGAAHVRSKQKPLKIWETMTKKIEGKFLTLFADVSKRGRQQTNKNF